MNLIPRRQLSNKGPFTDLLDIQKEMNSLFDFSLSRWGERDQGLLESSWAPAIDVYDSKDNLIVTADLPGLKKEDIDISVQDGTLVIKGEKKRRSGKKREGFHPDGTLLWEFLSSRFFAEGGRRFESESLLSKRST